MDNGVGRRAGCGAACWRMGSCRWQPLGRVGLWRRAWCRRCGTMQQRRRQASRRRFLRPSRRGCCVFRGQRDMGALGTVQQAVDERLEPILSVALQYPHYHASALDTIPMHSLPYQHSQCHSNTLDIKPILRVFVHENAGSSSRQARSLRYDTTRQHGICLLSEMAYLLDPRNRTQR